MLIQAELWFKIIYHRIAESLYLFKIMIFLIVRLYARVSLENNKKLCFLSMTFDQWLDILLNFEFRTTVKHIWDH